MTLIWILVVPLATSLLTLILGGKKMAGAITLIASAAVLFLSARAAMTVAGSGPMVPFPDWIGCDGFGALLLVLISFVGFTSSIFSLGYMDHYPSGGTYWMHFNLFLFSMLAIPLFQEPAMVWIAVAFTTLFSVLLVSFEKTGEALEAGWKYAALTLMGASIALLGILLLAWGLSANGGGAFTWDALYRIAPRLSPALVKISFLFVLVGFGVKTGLSPFHTWLPDAHSQAPSPVCALLSGVETSAVLYVILKLFPILKENPSYHLQAWAFGVGLFSVGTAAFLLLQVKDYKRLFAFSTVEHMGIVLAAAGLADASGSSAAIYQIVGHAVTKSFCFLAAGSVLFSTGKREIASVRGFMERFPFGAAALLLGGLAITGAPPFPLFMSELLVLKAWFAAGYNLEAGLLAVFLVIAFFGILFKINHMVFGKPHDETLPRPVPMSCKIALVLAAVPIVTLGVYLPRTLQTLLHQAAMTIGGHF